MEIKPGIYLLENISGANCYLCLSASGLVIIDTGMPGNGKKIVSQLKNLKRSPDEIKLIILTHSDVDHSGSAAELKRLTGARIAIHEGDEPGLSGKRELKKTKGLFGSLTKILMRLTKFEGIAPDFVLKDGFVVEDFLVVHTPGHTGGSICLLRSDGVLFVGDALRVDEKGNAKLSPKMLTENAKEAFESIKKISMLEFETLLPGHGGPLTYNASTKVKRLVYSIKPMKHEPKGESSSIWI